MYVYRVLYVPGITNTTWYTSYIYINIQYTDTDVPTSTVYSSVLLNAQRLRTTTYVVSDLFFLLQKKNRTLLWELSLTLVETALPFGGQTTQISSTLSQKRGYRQC